MDERRAFFRSFVADILRGCSEHRVQELAAALAFYGALSVAPLLVVVAYLAGNFLGQHGVQGELFARLQSQFGDRVAQLLARAVANASPRPGHYPALIGGAVALMSAAGLFQQVRTALRRIWGVPDEEGLRGFLRRKGSRLWESSSSRSSSAYCWERMRFSLRLWSSGARPRSLRRRPSPSWITRGAHGR